VNKLLKDLPHDSAEYNGCDAEQDNQKLYENQEDVKNATLDQLRKMGISFHNSSGNGASAEVGRYNMRFEVFIGVEIWIVVFWVMMLCSLVYGC
jgi:hypothetical protein